MDGEAEQADSVHVYMGGCACLLALDRRRVVLFSFRRFYFLLVVQSLSSCGERERNVVRLEALERQSFV